MSIKLLSVNKSYGSQKVLNEISFEIPKGEVVAFLGPNGAGKSTTMKIMTGLLSADSGVIEVNGLTLGDQSHDIRHIIGYLPENNPLYLDMYVREYLEFVAGFYTSKQNIRKRIEELIEQIGLTKEAHKQIGQLSKGYRQRVGLAQALIHNPEVLILDEPTTGLDPNQLIEIRRFIKEIAREKTVILSTHILQEATSLCDRAIIIHRGEIVADKPMSEILTDLGMQIFEVEFSKPIEASELKEIADTTQIVELSKYKYKITADYDIREALFNYSVEKKWTIIHLCKKENTLESFFGEMTV